MSISIGEWIQTVANLVMEHYSAMKRIPGTHDNVKESQKHCHEWTTPDREEPTLYNSIYVKF